MPAATNKADLLAVTDRDWAKLTALIETVPDDIAVRKFEDETSIKDVLAHRAHWIGLFFQWLDEGEAAQMPDHGVKWNALKPYNANLRARYDPKPWPDVIDWLKAEHEKLRGFMERASEAELYGGPMPGGSGWTIGRYAEASGPSHYRSAAKFLRTCLRNA